MKAIYSVKTIKNICGQHLTANEKLLLILILDYQRCESIYVSASTLAEQSSLSESTVKRVFCTLKAKGILHLKKIRSGQSYRYIKVLDIDQLEKLSDPSADTDRIEQEQVSDSFAIDLSDL